MNTAELQNLDIEQAKIIISLKNDEISNLKATLRTTEIKNNLRQADLKHKIDQSEHKLNNGEAKLQKSEENNRKVKLLLEQEIKRLEKQIEKGKQNHQKFMAHSHQKERELNGIVFEEKLKFQREKQHSARLSSQLEVVLKYFDPKKVLATLQKQKLDEVPTYLQLYEKWKNAKDALDFANHHLATIKSEIVSEMQKSFEKLSSYESVMEDLRFKNEQLRLSVEEKEELLKQNSKEISSRENLIETIRQEADLHLQHLNQEIVSLKQQVASYEHLQSKEPAYNPTSIYLEQLEDLQRKLYEKQLQLDRLSSSFDQKILQLENQNRTLKEVLQQTKLEEASKLGEYVRRISEFERERDDQREVISLLNETVRDQEESIAELTKQLNKRSEQITQILRKRKKIQEQYRVAEENLKTSLQICSQELEYLKQKINLRGETQQIRSRKFSFSQKSMTSNEQENSKKLTRVMSGGSSFRGYAGSKNLLIDLTEEINSDNADVNGNTDLGYYQPNESWSQKYHNLLRKHNQFIKLVQYRLRNIGLPL